MQRRPMLSTISDCIQGQPKAIGPLQTAGRAVRGRARRSALKKFAFDAEQAMRVSWFFGQKLLAGRISRPVPLPDSLRGRPMPDKRRILADLWTLIEQDWHNIKAGYYVRPNDSLGSPFEAVRRAADFFADLSSVERRRHGAREERFLGEVPPGS